MCELGADWVLPDNTELIKVTAATLGPKWLLKCDNNGSDIVTVPDWIEYPVTW